MVSFPEHEFSFTSLMGSSKHAQIRISLVMCFGVAGCARSTLRRFVIRFSAMASETTHSRLGKRLWWLISGRAAAVILLFLAGVAWRRSALGHGLASSLSTVAPLIVTRAGLTIIYGAARLLWKNFLAQARVQFLFDVVLVTWLVWITGSVSSPYAALYIVIISVASLFVG